MPRNREERPLRFVKISVGGQSFIYYFNTPANQATRTALGILDPEPAPIVVNAVYKPNNLKPGKAQKFVSEIQGYNGSFYSTEKRKELKAAGWKPSNLKYTKPSLSGRAGSVLYYGLINGIKVGYRLNELASELPSDFLAVTGLKVATVNDIVIMDTTFPKLMSVKYLDPQTSKEKTYKAVVDNAAAVAAADNWSVEDTGLSTSFDLARVAGVESN